MEKGLRVEPMSLDLARPVSAGDEWVYLEPAPFLEDGQTPLQAGQFVNIGSELRIILGVGERVVKVAAVEESHGKSEYVYRPAQLQIGDCWYRL
jgi:hypothetical protein